MDSDEKEEQEPFDENEELIIDGTEDVTESPSRRGPVIAVIVIVLLLAGLAIYLVWLRRAAPAEPEAKEDVVVSVKVVKAEKGPIALESTSVGNVAPSQQSTVAASIAAPIRQMGILKNAVVKRGD